MPNDVQHCLTTGIDQSCSNSSHFYCNQSMKCISYYRVGDGKIDCFFKEDQFVDLINRINLFVHQIRTNV